MTIRGLFRELAAERLRARDELDHTMVLAWHVAALQRTDKLPALKTLLTKPERPAKQTIQQVSAVMHQLSAQLGVEIRRTRLVKRVIH